MSTLKIGVHGDGTHGHQHTRIRASMLLETIAWDQEQQAGPQQRDGFRLNASALRDVATSLRGDMPDDAWDEGAACEMLDEYAPVTDARWGWHEGDFGLWYTWELDGTEDE